MWIFSIVTFFLDCNRTRNLNLNFCINETNVFNGDIVFKNLILSKEYPNFYIVFVKHKLYIFYNNIFYIIFYVIYYYNNLYII